MRVFLLVAVACLSACAWFSKKTPVPDPTEIIVTGAPLGSMVFVDGAQAAQATTVSDRPQILEVPPGAHKVEIHAGGKIVYREDTYVGPSEHRVVRVLSGLYQ